MITELKAKEQKLVKLSSTAPLTGLLNRRAFEQRFDQEVSLIQLGTAPVALILIDLDRFKTVNDTLGHDTNAQRHFPSILHDRQHRRLLYDRLQ
ncbi:MAG: GGDEF domain-containing protein [Oleiphilaceae bacterium]|nr:GGDEF domain-containing protein [Oleiphilaceae bacterium]